MEKIWVLVIAIVIFTTSTLLFWRITARHRSKEYGKKMWKLWGARTYYWQAAIYISTGVTILIMFLLKWGNILTF